MVMSIVHWGDMHMVDERGRPLLHQHKNCGKMFDPVMVCSECGEPLHAKEVHVHSGPGAATSAAAPGAQSRPIDVAAPPNGVASRLVHLDPAALTVLAHFAMSFTSSARNCSGELASGDAPCLASISWKSVSFRISATSALILLTIAGLSPAGPKIPHHGLTSKSLTPLSAIVGVSGEIATRCALLTASARTNPCLNRPDDRWRACERCIQMATDHVGNRLRRSLVGHMGDTDVGLDLEHLAKQMIDRAVACRTVVQLVGIGPRQVEKLVRVFALFCGPTINRNGVTPRVAIGSKSLTELNGSFSYRLGLIACEPS